MILHKIIDIADDFLDYITSMNKSSIVDYCDIEAPNSKATFVAKDGALGTIIEVRGLNRNLTTSAYQDRISDVLSNWLKPNFDKKGHALQVYYSCDPTKSRQVIEKAQEKSREATKNIGLNLDNLFTSRTNVLERYIVDERIFIAIWTTPEVLTKTELQKEKNGAKKTQQKVFGVSRDSLDPFLGFKSLTTKHQVFVQSVVGYLSEVGLNVGVFDVKKMAREMRRSVDPIYTSEDWEPILPGERILPAVHRTMPEKKVYDAMSPKFSWQLMTRNAKEINDKTVLIGDNLYAPCYVEVMPNIEFESSFNALCNDMNAQRIPWRVSFLIEGDGLSNFALTKVFSQILTITNSNNLMVTQAINILNNVKLQNITAVAQIRVAFATWCKAEYRVIEDKPPELILNRIDEQREILVRTVKKWDNTEVIESTGDPLDSTLSSALAIKRGSLGTKMAAPLNEIMRIMPFNRITSPWESGGVLFRTGDGKLIPYRPYSQLQDTFISLVWAPPGAGKSVLLNYLNTGLCMEESNIEIPYVRTIDVGKSSYGFSQLIQNALPENMQYLVVAERMRNIKEKSINVFDTPLGCRTPLPADEIFLKNFFKLIMSNEDGTVSNGIEGLVDSLVPELYLYFSDKRKPKKYAKGFSNLVDKAILEIGFPIEEGKTSYWQIVDALFLSKRYREARVAQTFAVPVLSDAATILTQSENLKNYYAIRKDAGDEGLIDEFKRKLKEVLERYPMLNDVTKIDFANAKIVTLDLDEVVKPGLIKNNSLMYMVARYILGKDFYVAEDEAMSTPAKDINILNHGVPYQKYQEFHRKNFIKIREEKKRINLDEFHLTRGSVIVRDQVESDMRLGRKYNVEIILLSQFVNDFSETMLEAASAVYIMSNMSEAQIKYAQPLFDLNETEQVLVSNTLGRSERMFLGRYKMGNKYKGVEKWASFRMTATLSPEELWAYNTTTINASVRDNLYKKLGARKTLSILGQLYPEGVQGLLESGIKADNLTEEEMNSNTERIVAEILKSATDAGLMEKSFFS